MRSGVVTKEAQTLLKVHRNSTSRRLDRLIVPARLMAADPARFMICVPSFLRGEPLSITLISWPEAKTLCGYQHIGWEQFIAAVAPAFETFRTLWNEDQTQTFETMAPYVEQAIKEKHNEARKLGNDR